MTKYLTPQEEYDVKARRISGTHTEKLEQIDAAIQELLAIKMLECAGDRPGVYFLAVPKPRSHAVAMVVTILAMLILLVLLLGVRAAHAQVITAKKAPAAASRWGVELTAQAGRDTDTFGFSPTAPNIGGADWLRRLGPTNASYLAPLGHGLTIQGGIFGSLIGYDSLYAKDNFAYTRPWGADFTPYFMLGGNVAYPFTDSFTLTGFVVNSYFHLSQPNSVPNGGAQFAFAPTPQLSLKETAMFGSHQADTSLSHWRSLSDTIVERKWKRATVARELQLATETVAGTDERASWVSAQMPIHLLVGDPWSVTLRPEVARDPSGRYTSVQQTVYAMTTTIEVRKHVSDVDAIVRGEYRFDNSTGASGGFFSGPDNALVPHQQLLIAAFIVAFDHAFPVSR